MNPLFDAVLPAGGLIAPPFSDAAGTRVKALIELQGATLLERIIGALRESGCVGRIVVVGPPELLEHPAAREADHALLDGGANGSGPDNILRALEWLQTQGGDARRVLVVTTDLPFLAPADVRDFLAACPSDAALCVPAVKRANFEARYPGLGGEWVRLRDGEWTLGGIFLADAGALLRARPHIERAFAARKSQWQMARLLGPVFIARWMTRRLSTAHVLARCESLIGCRGALVEAAPALAFDLDTREEWEYAQRLLA